MRWCLRANRTAESTPSTAPPISQPTSEADGCEVRTAASAPAAATAKNGMPSTSLRIVRLYPTQRKLAFGLLPVLTKSGSRVSIAFWADGLQGGALRLTRGEAAYAEANRVGRYVLTQPRIRSEQIGTGSRY